MFDKAYGGGVGRLKVLKITPTGRIKTEGRVFDKRGREMGAISAWNRMYIRPFDAAEWEKEQLRQRSDNLAQELAGFPWKVFPAEVIAELHAIASKANDARKAEGK